MTDCLEEEFLPNETDDDFRNHNKLVRRGVNALYHTRIESSIELNSVQGVRQIIKSLDSKKAEGTME